MSQIIAVTAGKGGTGKSTTSANVATALAALGKKTLVVELDFGLRCLDIMLGIKDKVKHDIGEYLVRQRFPPASCDMHRTNVEFQTTNA